MISPGRPIRPDQPGDLMCCFGCKRLLVYRSPGVYEEATEGDIAAQSIPAALVADRLRRLWMGDFDDLVARAEAEARS